MKIASICVLSSVLCATFVSVAANPPNFPSAIGALLDSFPNVLNPEAQLKKVWQEVEKKGPELAEQLLGQITKAHSELTPIIHEFKDSIDKAIVQARIVHDEIQKAIAGKGITMDDISMLISQEVGEMHEGLEDEVDDSLLEDHGHRSRVPRDRARLVSQTMEKLGIAYIHVLTEIGVPRQVAETQFNEISSRVTPVLLIAGEINDKYPFLLDIIIFVISMLLFPHIPFLRPILSLFGFGPLGPIKGSVAAWAQRTFWGAAVARGSWFAILQRLGMTVGGSLFEKLLTSAGLAAFAHVTESQQDI